MFRNRQNTQKLIKIKSTYTFYMHSSEAFSWEGTARRTRFEYLLGCSANQKAHSGSFYGTFQGIEIMCNCQLH